MASTPTIVGVDISSMEAIQSLFGKRIPDPWGLECLANWIDVTVNYPTTLYALPKALGDLDLEIVLPLFLRRAEEFKLIGPVDDESAADRISLSEEEIHRLYVVFEAWASSNLKILTQWLEFTAQVRRIDAGRFIDQGRLNLWVRDSFWPHRPAGWLSNSALCGIPTDSQQLAFDMVVRAAQYHAAFGSQRGYQPHPLRNLYVPTSGTTPVSHSWGWIIINRIANGNSNWDPERLIEAVLTLRGLIGENHATADELLADTNEVRQEKLNSIAVASGGHILPPSFDKWIHAIALAIGISLKVFGDLHHIPVVGVAWEFVSIPLITGAKHGAEHLNCVQRRVEFPGTAATRPSMNTVQKHLRA